MTEEIPIPAAADRFGRNPAAHLTALGMIVAFCVVNLWLCHRKYLTLDVTHFDLLHVLQFYGYVREGGFSNLINHEPYLFFAVIQEPSHLLGILTFVLWRGPYGLFALQTLYFGVGFYLVYRILVFGIGRPWVALAPLAGLLANPYLWCFASLGFRPNLSAIPFFLAFVYLDQRGKKQTALMMLILAGLAKLTLMFSFSIMGLGFWLFRLDKRNGRRIFLWCLAIFLAMGIGSAIAKNVLHLTITTDRMHLSAYGETAGEVVTTLLTKPGVVLGEVINTANLANVLFMASFAFLPLLGGRYLLCLVSEFGLVLLSTTSLQAETHFNNVYPRFLDPLVYVHNNHFYLTGIVMATYAVGMVALWRFATAKQPRWPAEAFVGGVSVLMLVLGIFWPALIGGPKPLNIHFDKRYYTQSQHDRTIWRLTQDLRPNEVVRSQWNLFPKGVWTAKQTRDLEWNRDNIDEDAIVLDLYTFEYLMDRREFLEFVQEMLARPDYGVVVFEDGFLMLRRNAPRDQNGEIEAYIERNWDLLMSNFYRPYRDAFVPEPTVGDGIYSPTQTRFGQDF
ncbi:MAG: hypothetical protein H6683_10830 [Deltaproteobacteria bacterium]|nr:hypothetical protein [Deltaproteobacteria bacterium]